MAVAKKSPAAEAGFTNEAQALVSKTVEAASKPLLSVHENVRAVTEKTLEQARTQYSTMKKAAEDATGTLESTVGAFTNSAVAFNTKALEALRANTNATIDHLTRLQGVTSLAEAIELHASHLRGQIETFTTQAKQFQELAQKSANEVIAPVKAAITKG